MHSQVHLSSSLAAQERWGGRFILQIKRLESKVTQLAAGWAGISMWLFLVLAWSSICWTTAVGEKLWAGKESQLILGELLQAGVFIFEFLSLNQRQK